MIKINWVKINEYIKILKSYHSQWEHLDKSIYHKEFFNIEIFEQWCKKNNIIKYLNSSSNWTYLYSYTARWNPNIVIPHQDHKELFKTSDGKNIMIIQPYHYDLNEIENWAASKGISVIEDKELSWHFPNHTTLIQLQISNIQLFKKSVKDIVDLTRKED